jgi:hypothetical protein
VPGGLEQPHENGTGRPVGVALGRDALGGAGVASGCTGVVRAVGKPALVDGLAVGPAQAPMSRTTATAAHILCMH